MSAFVKYGRKNGQTQLHLENTYIPKTAVKGERVVLQPESLQKLFTSKDTCYRGKPVEDFMIYAYRFEVATGLRPGELLALRMDDVTDSAVFIRRSYNVHNEYTQGKNENARRMIGLNEYAKKIIKEQKKLKLRNGIRSELLFCNPDGGQVNQKQYYHRWVKYRTYNGLDDASPYDLRHTFASFIKGLSDDVLKASMGHSYSFDTRATHTHELDGDLKRNAELISEAFGRYL